MTYFDVKFDIWECCDLWDFFAKNMYLENDIFKMCLRQSAKCKLTAQALRKYKMFEKI